MDTKSIKERIQNKRAIARGFVIRNPFHLWPPWILFGYVPMIKQPQV